MLYVYPIYPSHAPYPCNHPFHPLGPRHASINSLMKGLKRASSVLGVNTDPVGLGELESLGALVLDGAGAVADVEGGAGGVVRQEGGGGLVGDLRAAVRMLVICS